MKEVININIVNPNISLENAINSKITVCGYYRNYSTYVKRDSIDDNILIYCLAGEGMLEIDGIKRDIKQGSVVYLPKNTAHIYYAKENSWSIYWAHFKGDIAYFDSFMSDYISNYGIDSSIVQCFESMLQSVEQSFDELAFLTANAWLNQILYKISHYTKQLGHENDLVTKVKNYLNVNLYHNINLDDLATEIGFSKYHLCREFKKSTDETIINYFNKLKVLKACEYLSKENLSVVEVSEMFAFQTQYYFSYVFKQVTGYSPSQYKKIIQNNYKPKTS